MPEFGGDLWSADVRDWLAARGCAAEFLPGHLPAPAGWAIAGVRVLTGAVHAVVCFDGRISHDPSPRPLTGGPRDRVIVWTAIQGCP